MSTATVSIQSIPQTPSSRDELVTRLAARIAADRDEVAPFATVDNAFDALVERFFRNRRVIIGGPTREALASRAWAASRAAKQAPWLGARCDAPRGSTACAAFDALIAAAREADTVVLSSPFAPNGRCAGALAPRDLLQLRARAPRPVIVLDLLDEDLAQAPLTQPALMLPGVVFLRGFGEPWRLAGARSVAEVAFVAGPGDLIGGFRDLGPDERTAESAVWDLDRIGVDAMVQQRTLAARSRAAGDGTVPSRGDARPNG
jgi:histidinol-phosphate/aromatic aminotransferase/cobyric acid decarboxylase-like protein